MVRTYLLRIAGDILAKAFASSGAAQIRGPKRCGKTTTGFRVAASFLYMQDPSHQHQYPALADSKPSSLLKGATLRLINEWQMALQLWDAVCFTVDQHGLSGQFIPTGSPTPTAQGAYSGVGRIERFSMRTMSLFEPKESNGQVSLVSLFDGAVDIGAVSPLDADGIARVTCRGGWPAAVTAQNPDQALRLPRIYADEPIPLDISRMDGVRRNETHMRALICAYARHVSTQASTSTISADLMAHDDAVSPGTVIDYLDALTRSLVIENLEAWAPALRSQTVARTTPTRHFINPLIGFTVMRASPRDLLGDFETFGLHFESSCMRDLRTYAEVIDGTAYHYRDKTGLGADIVFVLVDGWRALIEVELGLLYLDAAAANLHKLSDRVDSKRMDAPSFLAVVIGIATVYRCDDDVFVIPLARPAS